VERYVDKDPEFHLTDRYLQLYEEKDFGIYGTGETLPLCFTTTNDVTGGNSGAPVLNGDGELIGLVFDVNREGCVSPLAYNDALHRSICVDIRYVLWVVDKYANAEYVLKDLSLK